MMRFWGTPLQSWSKQGLQSTTVKPACLRQRNDAARAADNPDSYPTQNARTRMSVGVAAVQMSLALHAAQIEVIFHERWK